MRESVTYIQHLSITTRYLATGNNFEEKFIRVISQSTGIIYCAGDTFTVRQTDGD
jgi:hypothetical protein